MGSSVNDLACRERTFSVKMVASFGWGYIRALRWLRHLLERLGRDNTLLVWRDALKDYDDVLLMQILNTGWEETSESQAEGTEKRITEFVATLFPVPVEGVTGQEAREIIDHMPPFKQIRELFPTLDVRCEMTFFEALHLFSDGLPLIAEALVERYGKAGELLVYDTSLAELSAEGRNELDVAEFMARRVTQYSADPEESPVLSAALKTEVIKGTDNEVITRVTECEYARYYRERHPQVGYLLCCSRDNAAYQLSNKRLRLQRETTLMEGGSECDFRVYALDEALVS